MTAVLFSLGSFFSTSFGGLLALRLRDKLRFVMGFTAGVLVALVAFDLLPEIFRLVHELNIAPVIPMVALMVGYLAFYVVEKLSLIHHSHESEHGEQLTTHPQVGLLSAIALSGHSFLDGVGIGIGFKASVAVGVIVSIAVIGHDFTDGLNTVTLMLVNRNTRRRAFGLLMVDALAPVLGVVSTLVFAIPSHWLPVYLGFFAGFLLYIGAGDILPEAHSERSSRLTLALTVAGAAFAFAVTRVV